VTVALALMPLGKGPGTLTSAAFAEDMKGTLARIMTEVINAIAKVAIAFAVFLNIAIIFSPYFFTPSLKCSVKNCYNPLPF
jgi:hypothetical protein